MKRPLYERHTGGMIGDFCRYLRTMFTTTTCPTCGKRPAGRGRTECRECFGGTDRDTYDHEGGSPR